MTEKSFATYLREMPPDIDIDIPPPAYNHGVARVAWQLWRLMLAGPENVQLAAIKEIADRCEGKTTVVERTQVLNRDEFVASLDLSLVSQDEAETFGAILGKFTDEHGNIKKA